MINYNSEKHHDTIVEELFRCFCDNKDVNRPISPKSNEKECYIIADGKTYCIDMATYSELVKKVHHIWLRETKKRLEDKFGFFNIDIDKWMDYHYVTKLFSLPDSLKYDNPNLVDSTEGAGYNISNAMSSEKDTGSYMELGEFPHDSENIQVKHQGTTSKNWWYGRE